ncbi:MAG: DsrE family protein [Sphingobacteriales bacterium]|nr:DsrE family protein [Sphingobacteriales bacterium]
MKKIIPFLLATLFISATIKAQQPYNVVFDITSKDTTMHQTVLRWIKLITDEHKDAKLEVVFYGKSIEMVTQDKSTVADEVIKYAKMGNVQFKVCEVAMKHWKIEKSQLLPGVLTVPDGIYEIISKQGEGWGYIKVVQ